MNRFDKRKQKIITSIANSTVPLTGKALGISLNLSLRTIQNEVAAINKVLPLIHSSNKGYTMHKDSLRLLNPPSFEQPETLTPLRHLLFAGAPNQIDELAESLYMSTSTLERHLKNYEPLLSKFHLKIVRKNAYIQISGNEASRRRLLQQLILKEITPAFNSIRNLTSYFPNIDLEKMKSIILSTIDKYGYYIMNAYYNNILVNIVIALYRMRSDHYVEDNRICSADFNSCEFKIACEICMQYAAHFHISPSENDISYITSLLEGQIKPKEHTVSKPFALETLSGDFISEIDGILKEVFQYYMLDIDYSDYLHSFVLHINELIKRASNTQSASNEILKNIKRSCPFIHDVAVSIAEKIEERYQIEIADSEIGYISIHIGYLIETVSQSNDKAVLFLLYNDYHHISDSIEEKIRKDFSAFVELHIFELADISFLQDAPADLIITTQPLNLIGKKILLVSPFYTHTDRRNINAAIHSCLNEKRFSRIHSLLSSFSHEKLFFKEDYFHSKEEVIYFLGKKAIDYGLVQEDFIESVLKRERISSTCFFDTFAIPHGIDMSARRTMVCILISSAGIPWDEHRIHIVLMITVHQQDRKKFMELYNGIVRILENPEKVKHLIACNTYMEFIQCLLSLETDL